MRIFQFGVQAQIAVLVGEAGQPTCPVSAGVTEYQGADDFSGGAGHRCDRPAADRVGDQGAGEPDLGGLGQVQDAVIASTLAILGIQMIFAATFISVLLLGKKEG